MQKVYIIVFILISTCAYSFSSRVHKVKINKANYEARYKDITVFFNVYNAKGDPVQKGGKDDFQLFFNNKKTDFFLKKQKQKINISLLLLVDASGSINAKTLSKIEKKAHSILSKMRQGDEVTLFSFNDYPMRLQDLTKSKEKLLNSIRKIGRAGKLSRLYNAVYRGVRYLSRSAKNEKKVIVILSDGKEEGSTIGIDKAINIARKHSIPIYSIGYSNINRKYFGILKKLSSATNGDFSIEDKDSLSNKILSIEKNIHKIIFKPKGIKTENLIKIKIKNSKVYGQYNLKLKNSLTKENSFPKNGKKSSENKQKKMQSIDRYIILIGTALSFLMIMILIIVILVLRRRKIRKKEHERVLNNEILMVENMKKEKDEEIIDSSLKDSGNIKTGKNMGVKSVGIELGKSATVMEIDIEVELEKENEENKIEKHKSKAFSEVN